jgi:branched-chain amino acid transport system substrate-binding protein
MPLSGQLGGYGQGELQGVKAAVKQLNDAGGVDGHQVQLTIKDDQGVPATAVTLLQQALSGGSKPDLVIPGITPTEGVDLTPVTTQAHVISVTAGASPQAGDVSTAPYSFVAQVPYDKTGASAAELVYQRGLRRVAEIGPADSSGQQNLAGFATEFEKLGGKIVSSQTFDPLSISLTSVFVRAAASNPDALYVANEGQGVFELKAHYVAAPKIPLYGDIGFTANFAGLVPHAQLQNAYGLGVPILTTPPAQRTARQQQFWTALESVGGDKGNGAYITGGIHDGVMAVAAAAAQAKNFSADSIKQALENLQGNTAWALGYPLHFTAQNHYTLSLSDPNPYKFFPLTNSVVDGAFTGPPVS